MKTVGKKVVSVILTLIMVISIMAVGGGGFSASAVNPSDLTLRYPVSGYTSMYVSGTHYSSSHTGTDFGGNTNSDALAAADGVVAQTYTYNQNISSSTGGQADGGTRIAIYHASLGIYTVYKHLDAIYVSTGQSVKAGDAIGSLGNTGYSFGVHLHFDICTSIHNYAYPDKGTTLNPEQCHYYFTSDTTPPTITSAYATQIDSEGYTAVAIFDDNVGVTRVRFATWTADNGQDDLIWVDGYIEAGGKSAYARVRFSDHNNEPGTYVTHAYAYDAAGNNHSKEILFTRDQTPPLITQYGITQIDNNSFVVYCCCEDNVGVTKVQFPTWTANGGQDDLIWYNGNFEPDGVTACVRVWRSNHNNEHGYYVTHVYVWDAAGNCSKVEMGILAEENPPVISGVVVSDITTSGYTVTCTVTDENSINRVQFPSWHTWDDLIWLNGSINGSSASCRINISDFANAAGDYTTHIYAWDIWGNVSSINAGTVYVPSESERHTVTYNSNGGTGTPASQSGYVNPSMSIVLSETIPTREGYTFTGWNTQADGTGTSYAPGVSYTTEADVTLYAQWIANMPAVNPAAGSGAVVDESTHFIYGLSAGAAQGCVAVTDGTVSYEYLTAKQALGTGTKVNIFNNDNVLVDSYTVVVFGDIDGDGWYNGTDAYFVSLVASGLVSANTLIDAQRMAADCNHDGVIDSADVAILEQAGLLLNQIDQTLPSEELQTNSVYLDYCSLIDQSVEIIEPEADEQPTADEPSPAAQNLFSRIMAVFTFILNWLLRVF